MKIIEQNRAPNPRRVRIFLAEKGIAMAFEQLDMMAGEMRTREFEALNPLRQVPVLILDDGTPIAETMAICRYLEALHPTPSLFGQAPLDVARIEMWNRRMELGLFMQIAQCFRHLHPAMSGLEYPQVAAWGEANRDRAIATMTWLDGELSERPYIAGDAFTIADITALVAFDFAKPARIDRPPELANLWRWHERVSSRPSAKA